VDLGEVESVLAQHVAVDQCVAISKQSAAKSGSSAFNQTYIVAYAVLRAGADASPQSLRDFVRERLPDHAVPKTVFVRASLPLSPNGKVDMYALSRMEPVARESGENYVPPRNDVERQLTGIWEKLLNTSPIGIEDDFFDIGGDSLTAIELMLIVEKVLQCRLPITALIQSPTIAALAGLVRGDGKSVSLGSLVPIRVQGSRPPLFCIHADGSVFIYREFAQYLDPSIPIYGLQAHGLANSQHQPYTRIEEMAAHYIREIRTLQPRGPYHLCAFSAGGLIIFEMARQWKELGEEVSFLGLLDAYGPHYLDYLPAKKFADYKISLHLNTLRLHGIQGQIRYLLGRVNHRMILTLSKLSAGPLLKLRLPMPRKIRYEHIALLIDRAAQTYPRGRTYAGNAVLFRALTHPEGIKPDPTLGWGELITGGLKIIDVVGTHNSIMMHEAHTAGLVRKIDEYLAQMHPYSLAPSSSGENPSRVDSAILSVH
jgi:aspartate racemase